MKKRLLFYEISQNLEHKNALVITGMRQVGKTTLMRQLFDELGDKPKLWFDFDNPLDQKMFEEKDYENIYRRLNNDSAAAGKRVYVFVDEIQNFPEITKVIKYLIDHHSVKFVVTGSSNYYLKNLFPESLSGRKFLYYLPPMNFREILYFYGLLAVEQARQVDFEKNISEQNMIDYERHSVYYDEFLLYGGFPEVVTTADQNLKKQILRNIFASFFEKDLKILSDYSDIRELRDVILMLVPRVGSLIDVTKLANELAVSRVKIYSYLDFLQGVFLIKLLPKFSKTIGRKVAGGKKIYFTDTGILNTIGRVNDGQLFENAAINQLSAYGDLCFYNRRNKAEIDAVIDKRVGVEIKLAGTAADLADAKKIADKIGLEDARVLSRKLVEMKGFVSPVFI